MTCRKPGRGPSHQFRRMGAVAAATAAVAMFAALVLAWRVGAGAATIGPFPAGGAATPYTGLAFDTCTAPSLAAIMAWSRSPYRAIGVYIGGVNRACNQPKLTANWVTAVSNRKWRLVPIYVGLQPPCVTSHTPRRTSLTLAVMPAAQKMARSAAARQGRAAANDAVAKATALGIGYGSAVYDDIENYSTANAACRSTALRFVSAWTRELHRLGFVAGVYVNLRSGGPDLSRAHTTPSLARPDALWVARWDQNASLTGWPGVSAREWAAHRRAKQYRGPHSETHGGVTIHIDSDNLDAPVATVGYRYMVTSRRGVNGRTGPSLSYPIATTHLPGSAVQVVCQAHGSAVATTSVWDKLLDGTYVTDFFVSTPSKTGYSRLLPHCVSPTR